MKNQLLREIIAMSKPLFYITLLQVVFITFLRAESGNAQNKSLYEIKISLNMTNSTVLDVFTEIEEQTDFNFTYNDQNFNNINIDIKEKNKSLGTVLELISEKSGITFKRINDNIHVHKSSSGTPIVSETIQVMQGFKVSGIVTDENNEGLPGATILETGTTNGTISDINGSYSLTVANPETSVLQISFVGYATQEILVNNQSQINLTMQLDTESLDEVVVIGYGTVKKRDLTGAVSSVKSAEIAQAPVISPVEAIQGRVAGLDISRSSGSTGSTPSILLRGNRSLTASSEPIYIIDGIQGSIANLNPNDIASIDVLKDASSTAIYGSAGANGVIVITTKKAEKGQLQVDFNSYVSINKNPSFPSPLQGQAWLDYLEDGYVATYGTTPVDRDALLSAWNLSPTNLNPYIDNGQYINWVDETFKTGIQTNNTVSVRGGTEKVQASFSLGRNKTEGIYKDDNNTVYTLRGHLDMQAAKWAKFGITTGLIYRDQESNRSRVNKSFGMVPLGEAYDEDNNINVYPIAEDQSIISVLANNINGTYENNTKSYNFIANPYAEFTLAKGLTFRSRMGVSITSNRTGEFKSDHTYLMLTGSENAIRSATYSTSLSYGYIWENILNYSRTIAEDHNFGVTLITAYQSDKNESSYAYNQGFLYDDFKYYNLSAGSSPQVGSSYSEKFRMSYAGRLNYSYKSKYLVTGSVRYDGVSQLADKWDIFPAGALAWRISDEAFMTGIEDILSDLKLRAGYGVSGNSNINPYVTKTQVTNGADNIDLGGGKVLTTIPTQAVGNFELGWEKSYNLNLGLDFGLIGNRINGSVEWYNTDTKDVIYDRNLPSTNGGYTAKQTYVQYANIARMQNNGVEITLNSTNINKGDFQWNTTLTFSRNREKVKSINLGENTDLEDLISLGLFIGSPKDIFYDYKKTGIWQLGEEADAAVFGLAPGDVKVATSLTKQSDGVWVRTVEDEDGSLIQEEYTAENPYTVNATDDRRILGHAVPSWVGGIQNTFTYKSFDLNIFATARWGQMIDADLLNYFSYGSLNTLDNYDYWTETNPTNDFPRPYITRTTSNSQPILGLNYVDGSYIKIKNITLGYTLPEGVLSRIHLTNLRVYSTVYNALVITKSHLLEGIDPESGGSDSFPLYKQFVFGVNVSF